MEQKENLKQQGSDSKKSLYDPSYEKDSCGIGFVAQIEGIKSHKLVSDALQMLENMEHRGATGADELSGDGAGILTQIPDGFYREECSKIGIELPAFGSYAIGMVYFPSDVKLRNEYRRMFNDEVDAMGFQLIGYRDVPVKPAGVGVTAMSKAPRLEQVFLTHRDGLKEDALERKLYVLRMHASHMINQKWPDSEVDFYIPSLSFKTIIHKGQFRTDQVRTYHLDLCDERFKSAIALVHSRFSTNTFPKWKLAQPFRYIAHNGEINTVRGNVNWMKSNETLFESTFFTKDEIDKLKPILDQNNSDSANLDLMAETLVMGGRSLPHVLMMMVPEAWQESTKMDDTKKAFYEYHDSIMEPWDGPASLCFTDGRIVGATLDRNGLRPSRFVITKDNHLILASEAGALPVPQDQVVKKWRVQPGKIFYADTEQGKIYYDKEVKFDIAKRKPYREWLDLNQKHIDELPEKTLTYGANQSTLLTRQQAFGYSQEDLSTILRDMAENAKEPLGSMGADIPLAVLSNQSRHLSNYFKQQFAQVSNPPIDPIRERIVMSLKTSIGRLYNILSETPLHCKQIVFDQPVLSNQQLEKIRDYQDESFRIKTISATFDANGGENALEEALDRMAREADTAIVDEGYNVLLLSDRNIDSDHAPIPTLLATGAIHHHLVQNGLRVRAGLVVEGGDIRETHHYATLIGFGANAVNPYLAFETISNLTAHKTSPKGINNITAFNNYVTAIGSGLLKVMSKMGISTLRSYHGAQIFEALGLSQEVIDKCFEGTVSKLGGIGFDGIAKEVLVRHRLAFPTKTGSRPRLEEGGIYHWKQKGEHHLFNPESVSLLQKAARENDYVSYKSYAENINNQSVKAVTIRGLLDFKERKAISIDEVEPAENIFPRFATGAMSFGSISHEAHSTLAIAMNRIGGKSNSGEGGEDEIRFKTLENGDSMRSSIKQVASGRFGVTSNYLTNADEIQIKMAQGAKPGEGGQLPGHKVDDWIGRVRNSTPGVGLISPPPHHDIYSIEDLAQLIFDLKNANRAARINVKLVSKAGVGTIAAGVAKAHADVVLIAGHDGGTGASPISSVQHTGSAWEIGLAETHQTLVKNRLRDRITVQADGQMRTGRDLAIATLLGAEEWGVATAALVAEGCIMMRKCHLNTCPVGVATQDKELRKLFTGKADHVVNFFSFLVEDLREIMAQLGFRTINEMVGQVDVLKERENIEHWKIKTLDLSPILFREEAAEKVGLYKTIEQDHGIDNFFDWKIIEKVKDSIDSKVPITAEFDLINTDRSIGALLSNEISKKYGTPGLPADTLNLKFRGYAGQSFGAFSTKGITLELEGEANDYFGKGLSGSKMIVYPDRISEFPASENVIIGNVAFYGATSGEAYINGVAGERFAVRNSGVTAVVEGVGRHGCEYMTGGKIIILGDIGSNFGAGMSGGVAFIYDVKGKFDKFRNPELVDFGQVDYTDEAELKVYVENHYKYTKSTRAKEILEDWDNSVRSFIKVLPEEYRVAVARMAAQKSAEEAAEKTVAV